MAARINGTSSSFHNGLRDRTLDAVSVPGLASFRPELKTAGMAQVEHDYLAATMQPAVECMKRCLPAAHRLKQHEVELVDELVVGKKRTFLPNLERDLKDLATSGATQGIFCITLYSHDPSSRFNLARIIEYGCMQGVSSDADVSRKLSDDFLHSQNFLQYHVFSEEDFAKKTPGDKRNRSSQQFSAKVEKVKPHLASLRDAFMSETCLKGGAVLLLKKDSKHNDPKDRFFFAFGGAEEDFKQLEEVLYAYRMRSIQQRPRTHLLDLGQHPDVQQQLEVIGSISHETKNIERSDRKGLLQDKPKKAHFPHSFVTCYDISGGKSVPHQLRIRLLHYLLKGDKHDEQVRYLLQSFAGPVEETSVLQVPIQDGETRAARRRANVERARMTAEEVQQLVQEEGSPVTNLASELSAFSSFKTSMRDQGRLYWVKREVECDVFVLNNYSSSTSEFQVRDFILADVADGRVTYCGCDIYKTLLGIGQEGNCMHCRFLEEEVVPLMDNVQQPGFVPTSGIGEKLLEAWRNCNVGCICVSDEGKVRKFCVKGSDNSVSFVHLSTDNSFVFCMSGACGVRMGCKKKLQGLESAANLCPHLDMFKAFEDIWQPFMDDGTSNDGELPAGDVNMDDDNQTPVDAENYFDSATGLWNFGGKSRHCPTARSDDKYTRNQCGRLALMNLPRDQDGYLRDHVLKPPVPESCACGAGYEDVNVVDGVNLVSVHQSTLYMNLGAVKCAVAARKCRQGTCKVDYDPEADSIFFWTESTCIGDEIGYSFLDSVLTMKCSFTAFCNKKTKDYIGYDKKATFVSVPTFIKWFFSWAAAFKFDFRQDVDPWCRHSPKVLAGDGTHVGVALRMLNVAPIEQAQVEEEVPTCHRRLDRVLLFQRPGLVPKDLQNARTHLKNVCRKVMGDSNLVCEDEAAANLNLLAVCPDEVKAIVDGLLSHSFNHDVLFAVADVLFVLGHDAPVSALLPYRCLQAVQDVVRDLQADTPPADCLERLNTVSPELKRLLRAASMPAGEGHRFVVYGFVLYLCERVDLVHREDRATPAAVPVPGSYNPPSGVAYYFTPTGEQVRQLPKYCINSGEDLPPEEERCRKVYPQVTRAGFSYMFLWFCPAHGHCYGFHLISGGEGRKDPFASMVKYLDQAPEAVFYDNACQLSEYCLNREPAFFQQTRFFHDCFHGFSHKCAKSFSSSRIPSMNLNSEICEQFNSYLQCIKYTGSHLSQPRFVFLAQLVLHYWNKEKTLLFNNKLQVACRGMQ